MITPSFSLTATERVLPKLALDFTTASLDARVTFTRTTSASNPATYVDSNGYIVAATNNQPRFDYNPVTLVCRGLLIEEQRQNILFPSEDFTGWTKISATVTGDAVVSPNNTLTADLVVADSGAASQHRIDKNVSITSGVTYTLSVYAKYAGLQWIILRTANDTGQCAFDLLNGTLSNSAVGTISNAGNGWYLCTVRGTATATGSSANRINVSNTSSVATFVGDGASGAYVWGAQLEAGAFATSYIPTTTAALTRNADVATMTGTNFSDWFNATEGTLGINATLAGVSSFTTFFANLNSNSTTNFIALGHGGTGSPPYFRVSDTNVDQCLITIGAAISTTQNQLVGSYKANNFDAGRNGASGTPDTSGTVPSGIDRMIFFNRNGADRPMSGWLQNFKYWPQQFTAAECAAFSKQ